MLSIQIQDKGDGAYRLTYCGNDGPAFDGILDTEGVVRQVAACLDAKVEVTELRVRNYGHLITESDARLIAERNADGRHPIG